MLYWNALVAAAETTFKLLLWMKTALYTDLRYFLPLIDGSVRRLVSSKAENRPAARSLLTSKMIHASSWGEPERAYSNSRIHHYMHVCCSLVPRPLPDLILQLWRKIGRRPGTITTSRTGNGGLDSYVMWTRFHNDGNVPTQYAASTASDRTVKLV